MSELARASSLMWTGPYLLMMPAVADGRVIRDLAHLYHIQHVTQRVPHGSPLQIGDIRVELCQSQIYRRCGHLGCTSQNTNGRLITCMITHRCNTRVQWRSRLLHAVYHSPSGDVVSLWRSWHATRQSNFSSATIRFWKKKKVPVLHFIQYRDVRESEWSFSLKSSCCVVSLTHGSAQISFSYLVHLAWQSSWKAGLIVIWNDPQIERKSHT